MCITWNRRRGKVVWRLKIDLLRTVLAEIGGGGGVSVGCDVGKKKYPPDLANESLDTGYLMKGRTQPRGCWIFNHKGPIISDTLKN